MHRLRTAAVAAGCFLAGLAIPIGTQGVLYLARGPTASWPGPTVRDSLPLDELAGHDGSKLIVFLLVWGAAAVVLAGLTRLAGVDRLVGALILTAGVGGWLYLLTGISLYFVRGLSTGDILHVPAHVQAVYLAAGLCGLAGATLGQPPQRPQASRAGLLAFLVAAAGFLDILSAVTPEITERERLIRRIASQPVPPLASAIVVPVGLVLLLTARGLARGKRRAWQIAVALLAGSSVLHLLKGLDFEEATVTGLLAVALFARREEFARPGDPAAPPRVLARLALSVVVVYGYGLSALWLNQSLADRPYTVAFAARETSAALAGLTITGSAHVGGSFGSWFPLSVLLLGAAGLAWVLTAWLAPWRYRLREETRAREAAHRLVAAWGEDTLAPFVMRADKSYFFERAERAVIAYTVMDGVAIVSGEPVGPADAVEPLVRDFLEFAHGRGWRVAVLGASDRRLDLYARSGLRSIYHGDEALVDVPRFSLEGRAMRKVRQAVHRLERAGYRHEVRWAGEVGPDLRPQLEGIVRQWRKGQPQKGFVMALDSLDRLGDRDAVFAIGRDAEGRPMGFLHLAVVPRSCTLSLSSMPRRSEVPNGFNEWLIAQTVAWARLQGFTTMSLNFSPFAAILDRQAELSAAQRLERRALLAAKSRFGFQLDNLLLFTGQFQPTWQPRFVLFERWTDLPRVGVAALHVEGYLPFGGHRAS